MRRLMDAERRSGDGANEVLIDAGRIKREIYPEWRVEDWHNDLKFDESKKIRGLSAPFNERRGDKKEDLSGDALREFSRRHLQLQSAGTDCGHAVVAQHDSVDDGIL